MPTSTFKLIASLLALALAGCASVPKPEVDNLSAAPTADVINTPPVGPCPVWIYRNQTYFHSLNPEKPFVYVNEERVSTIGVGETFCLNLKPGKYVVSIREPIFFMPGMTSGALVVEPSAGNTQYVRYSKEMDGIYIAGLNAVGVTSAKKLEFATKQAWEGRL